MTDGLNFGEQKQAGYSINFPPNPQKDEIFSDKRYLWKYTGKEWVIIARGTEEVYFGKVAREIKRIKIDFDNVGGFFVGLFFVALLYFGASFMFGLIEEQDESFNEGIMFRLVSALNLDGVEALTCNKMIKEDDFNELTRTERNSVILTEKQTENISKCFMYVNNSRKFENEVTDVLVKNIIIKSQNIDNKNIHDMVYSIFSNRSFKSKDVRTESLAKLDQELNEKLDNKTYFDMLSYSELVKLSTMLSKYNEGITK